jgi:hypothetical protein
MLQIRIPSRICTQREAFALVAQKYSGLYFKASMLACSGAEVPHREVRYIRGQLLQ